MWQRQRENAREGFIKYLEERFKKVEDFYDVQHGDWTQKFIENLGDDISKISFETYLSQRIRGHIHCDFDIVYPVCPPKKNEAWRQNRIASVSSLPPILGVPEDAVKFFHLTTFILEQYAIPGLVEAQPGEQL